VEHLFWEEVIAISDLKNVQDEDELLRGFSDSENLMNDSIGSLTDSPCCYGGGFAIFIFYQVF
jgi:hypothetical protein